MSRNKFYDLVKGDPEYINFVQQYYNITYKNLIPTEHNNVVYHSIGYNAIYDPVYSWWKNLLIFILKKLKIDKKVLFTPLEKIGILEYYANIHKWDDIQRLNRLLYSENRVETDDTINFLKKVNTNELERDKLYLVLYQEIGDLSSNSRYSNWVRSTDKMNYHISKHTFNHVGLLFYCDIYNDATNKNGWHIIDHAAGSGISFFDNIEKGSNTLLYITKLDKITLSLQNKVFLYDMAEKKKGDKQLHSLDKKTLKENVLRFGLGTSWACLKRHYTLDRNIRAIGRKYWSISINWLSRAVSKVFRKFRLEGKDKKICSQYLADVINQIEVDYFVVINKDGILVSSESYHPKDILNRVLFVDNKTFEDSVKILIN